MTSRLAVLVVDALDPAALADFWCQVLGYRIVDRDEEVISIAGDDDRLAIDLVTVPEPKTFKNRLHLDLRADGTSAAAELARLEGLGARRVGVGQAPDVSWVVLADPEGNEFCLLGAGGQSG